MALGGYFTRFLQLRDELSEDDLARLAAMPTRLETFEPGEVIVSPGPHTRSCLVVSGLAGRVTMLAGKPAVQAITALQQNQAALTRKAKAKPQAHRKPSSGHGS